MTELTDRDRALLVGLADGTLRGWRRRSAEAHVRKIPDGHALLERQRRVHIALADGTPSTRRRAAAAPRMAVAGALAAVFAALVFFQPDGRSVVAQAADLAQLPATAPAPHESGPLLQASVDGVPFPNWREDLGWRQTGVRHDSLDGRDTTTVFYEHMGHRIAYTIVPGPPLRAPANARIVRRDGLEIALYRDPAHGGHDIAVFERDGRTCVIAGHVERVETLVRLAAWNGDGAVRHA